ncbi:MAG: aminoacyl-tRNA hydrolase [Chloroflexi bacterium]|nr:aminoacyl-tRNA hydrolase [Chloroflexota bacterium]
MIEITPFIQIAENELNFEYIRASGPGGQNVNKVATAVQLRFDVNGSSLPEDVKMRLARLAGKRMTNDGILVIESKQHRTQERNREDAVQRLVELVRKAVIKPKKRTKTKPTAASKESRLRSKKVRSEIKRLRRSVE